MIPNILTVVPLLDLFIEYTNKYILMNFNINKYNTNFKITGNTQYLWHKLDCPLSGLFKSHCHFSDTVFIYMTQLKEQTSKGNYRWTQWLIYSILYMYLLCLIVECPSIKNQWTLLSINILTHVCFIWRKHIKVIRIC